MKYHSDLHWIFKALDHPELFNRNEGGVSVYDPFNPDFSASILLTTDEHFCRHADRVITSAIMRFSATVNTDGSRIPLIELPKNLQNCVWLDSEVQAAKIALRRYVAQYKPNDDWPQCTMSLAKISDDPEVLWPHNA
jgi:hypothetical protein